MIFFTKKKCFNKQVKIHRAGSTVGFFTVSLKTMRIMYTGHMTKYSRDMLITYTHYPRTNA